MVAAMLLYNSAKQINSRGARRIVATARQIREQTLIFFMSQSPQAASD